MEFLDSDHGKKKTKLGYSNLHYTRILRLEHYNNVDKNVAASLATGKLPSRDREREKNVGEREKRRAREGREGERRK